MEQPLSREHPGIVKHVPSNSQESAGKYQVLRPDNKQSIYFNFTLKIPHIENLSLKNTILDADAYDHQE